MALKFILNPISGNFDYIDTSTASSGSYNVEKLTLNASDISNKQITLSATPTTASDTRLTVIEGIEQDYSIDFTVSGSTLSWNGLGLESILEDGDKLVIIYN